MTMAACAIVIHKHLLASFSSKNYSSDGKKNYSLFVLYSFTLLTTIYMEYLIHILILKLNQSNHLGKWVNGNLFIVDGQEALLI